MIYVPDAVRAFRPSLSMLIERANNDFRLAELVPSPANLM